MSDWEQYATALQDANAFRAEPVQQQRVEAIERRLIGKVLDVGGGDGYPAAWYVAHGHDVHMVEISPTRAARARDLGLSVDTEDCYDLPYEDESFDTVVLGEILEHLDNPGDALSEAFRVAKERVVISLPLRGWADPTHQWRISLDICEDPVQMANEPTKGVQIVVTFQQGTCWPPNFCDTDPSWKAQFDAT